MTTLDEYLALNAKKNGPIIITQREYKTNIIYQDPEAPETETIAPNAPKKRKNQYASMIFLLFSILTILVYMFMIFLKGEMAIQTGFSSAEILAEQ